MRFTPSETAFNASTSKPESVSSSIANAGSKIESYPISHFFFSPPEKPKFRDLLVNSVSIPISLTF